jgi:DNA-binding NtrC family response regulator
MKFYAKISPFAPTSLEQPPGARYTTGAFSVVPARISKRFSNCDTFKPSRRKTEATSIYVVDNEECLTELYSLFLKGTGCVVRAFNHRESVLAALAADSERPDLLVMDCLGHEMAVERFMERCLEVHPALRILMASGLNRSHVWFSRVSPHRFLQKPFTAAEFLLEVRAALAG